MAKSLNPSDINVSRNQVVRPDYNWDGDHEPHVSDDTDSGFGSDLPADLDD